MRAGIRRSTNDGIFASASFSSASIAGGGAFAQFDLERHPSDRDACATRDRVDGKIEHAGMTPRYRELQHFDRAGEHHQHDGVEKMARTISQAEGVSDR